MNTARSIVTSWGKGHPLVGWCNIVAAIQELRNLFLAVGPLPLDFGTQRAGARPHQALGSQPAGSLLW